MDKSRHNEQIDNDILQCRADILRSQDIIPGSAPVEPLGSDKNSKLKTADIPKFDLAEQIMAEQRKITSAKRKGPDKNSKLSTVHRTPVGGCLTVKTQNLKLKTQNLKQPPTLPEQNRIIAEIVARDIERMCSGKTLL